MMKLKKMKYFYVIIETLQAPGEFSHNSIRARPITGQGFPANMRVECSTSMRKKYPVGTKIKIWAQKNEQDTILICILILVGITKC